MFNDAISSRFRLAVGLVVLSLLVSTLKITPVHAADVCYVKWDATGENSGASWMDAFTDLQSALATSSCTEIWVAAGTYVPTTSPINREASFKPASGVALYGGFDGTELLRGERDPAANVTILSGDIDHNDSQNPIVDPATVTGNTTNSFQIVISSDGLTLDGFTITAAYAYNPADRGPDGGGLLNINASNASITTLTNVIISGNMSLFGGGIHTSARNLILTNVTLRNNWARELGGGIYNFGPPDPIMTNVTFIDNFANQIFVDGGGGIYNSRSNPVLTNVTFKGNWAAYAGGGMANTNNSHPVIQNAVFWGNSAASGGAQIINGEDSSAVIHDSILQGDCPVRGDCTNILTTDPLLGALGWYGGFTQTVPLLPGSAAIDALDTSACPASDQRGMGRFGGCDIGAFESQGFTLSSGGNSQSAKVKTAFVNPLQVTVNANNLLELVDGGMISFTVPASGASAVLSNSQALISGGAASITATANDTMGSYTVEASANGSASILGFSLSNIDAPGVMVGAATAITTHGATLNGTVNAKNASSTITFDFGLDTSYGSTASASESPVFGMDETPVSAVLTNLAPNTTYHYRVTASNAADTTYSGDTTFTTLPAAPLATTTAANHVTTSAATLHGTVNPNNQATTVIFEYGLTSSYGFTVSAEQGSLTGSASLPVSAGLSGLRPMTTYHFRLVVTSAYGVTYGEDQVFTTLPLQLFLPQVRL